MLDSTDPRMDISGSAVAILCMPCRRIGGYFVPTSDLVLADLSGRENRHPVHTLAAWCHEPWLREELEGRATEVVLIFDDLAVTRSWMLPSHAPHLDDLWPGIRSATRLLTAGTPFRLEIQRLSEFLDRFNARRAFDDLVVEYAERFTASLSGPASTEKAAMEHELVRRRRYARETATTIAVSGLRERAAAQLANYAAQGTLMHRAGVGAYLPWSKEEIDLMAVAEPAVRDDVIAFSYGRHPRTSPLSDAGGPLLEAIPTQHVELREELALYLRDLPSTPGVVVSGLIQDITGALGKLLTPGLEPSARREIMALNQVLPGGTINRHRVEVLLDRTANPEISPRTRDATIKKLLCHLSSRYENDQLDIEHRQHCTALDSLVVRIPADAKVALGLTGSLTDAPGGIWHPYLSDIDVMPFFQTVPPRPLLEQIRHAYASVPRPPWLYLNTGAQAGVGGLTRDPHASLFAANQLTSLSTREFDYLDGCTQRLRFAGGGRSTYDIYVGALDSERSRRGQRAAHTGAGWTP